MIYFLTVRRASDTIDLYLENVAPELRSLIVPLHYERWLREENHPPGLYLLADIERLSPKQSARTAEIYQELSDSREHQFINHPLKTLRRYDLLQLMYDSGLNQFRVFRPGSSVRMRWMSRFASRCLYVAKMTTRARNRLYSLIVTNLIEPFGD